jgi:lipopolysaccharide biosynthesis glycosyltransferase
MLSWYHSFQNIVLYNEESVLNLYFYGRWNLLPIVYNSVPWHLKGLYKLKEENFLAFIIHFICCLKPWDEKSSFYLEWHHNLLKAEEIDLNNKLEVLPPFSDDELNRYLRYLKKRDFIFLILKPWLFINHQIGQLGKIIEKKNHKLYKLINLKRFLKPKHE